MVDKPHTRSNGVTAGLWGNSRSDTAWIKEVTPSHQMWSSAIMTLDSAKQSRLTFLVEAVNESTFLKWSGRKVDGVMLRVENNWHEAHTYAIWSAWDYSGEKRTGPEAFNSFSPNLQMDTAIEGMIKKTREIAEGNSVTPKLDILGYGLANLVTERVRKAVKEVETNWEGRGPLMKNLDYKLRADGRIGKLGDGIAEKAGREFGLMARFIALGELYPDRSDVAYLEKVVRVYEEGAVPLTITKEGKVIAYAVDTGVIRGFLSLFSLLRAGEREAE
jgi:hypothetical protein